MNEFSKRDYEEAIKVLRENIKDLEQTLQYREGPCLKVYPRLNSGWKHRESLEVNFVSNIQRGEKWHGEIVSLGGRQFLIEDFFKNHEPIEL